MYYGSGDIKILVYQSQFAGTNKATAAAWLVEDIAKSVTAMKDKGINFEHYDMGGVTHEGDLHIFGELKTAWFKYPDGNILVLD